jgi:hypothetical protein
MSKKFFAEKPEIPFSCVNLKKKPQKKETIAKVLKPQKLETTKTKKTLVQTLPIKEIFHFYL